MSDLAIVAAVGFIALALFQVSLALGAPLGRAAWGGGDDQLPTRLRIASAASAGIWVLAFLIILGRAGFHLSPVRGGFARWGSFVLVGVLALSAIMNVASRSKWERFLWGPVALTLGVLCYFVASGVQH